MEDIATLGFRVNTRDLDRAKGALDGLTERAGKAERASVMLARKLGAMAGVLVGAFAGNAVLKMVDQYTQLNNMLRVVEPSQSAVNTRMKELLDIANDTRSSLTGTATLYQRVGVASKELGATQADTAKFVEAVGYAMAQAPGNAQAAEGAMFQLAQALGNGNVQAEEFNSLMDGAYPLVLAAAKGIDGAAGSVGKLRTMVKAGEISSKEFFDAILSQAPELEKAFGNTTITMGQAFGMLNNNLIMFFGTIDRNLGISAAFASAVAGLAIGVSFLTDNAAGVVGVMAGIAASVATMFIPSIIAATAATVALAASSVTLTGVLGVLRLALLRTGIGAIVVGVGALVAWFVTLAQKVGGVSGALRVMQTTFRAVMDRFRMGAILLGEMFQHAATVIELAFDALYARLLQGFAAVTSGLASAWNSLLATFGMEGGAVGVGAGVADAAVKDVEKRMESHKVMMESFGNSFSALFTDPLFPQGKSFPGKDKDDAFPAPDPGAIAAVNDYGAAVGGAGGAAAEAVSELQAIADKFAELSEPFDQAGAAYDAVTTAFERGLITNDQYAQSLGKIESAFLRVGGSAEQWGMILSGETKTVATQLRDLQKQGFESLGGSIAELVVEGKADFGALAKSIIKDMINIAIQAAIIKPMMNFLGLADGAPVIGGQPKMLAKGGAIVGGALQRFAKGGMFTNSIVNKPTPFRFANGGKFGVMGEAGPEAVMPLKRGADGSLGVQITGAAQQGANAKQGGNVFVEVKNYAQNSQVREESEFAANGDEYRRIIIETTNDGMAKGEFDEVQGMRYGAKKARVIR